MGRWSNPIASSKPSTPSSRREARDRLGVPPDGGHPGGSVRGRRNREILFYPRRGVPPLRATDQFDATVERSEPRRAVRGERDPLRSTRDGDGGLAWYRSASQPSG